MAPQSNKDLIPIYTDWANRHLVRFSAPPIQDLASDLRDPLKLVTLLRAVTFGCVPSANDQLNLISKKSEPNEVVNGCLTFLHSVGVNISKVSTTDILDGQLGAVLSLLYALSTFKQQIKQTIKASGNFHSNNKQVALSANKAENSLPVESPKMPPSSKLPSPLIRPTTPSSRIPNVAPPSRIAVSTTRITAKEGNLPPSPAPQSKLAISKTSALRPPSSRIHSFGTNINNNETSRSSSRSSSVTSSSTHKSIPSSSSVPSTSSSNVPTAPSSASKMIKIKLFSGNKEKDKVSESKLSKANNNVNIGKYTAQPKSKISTNKSLRTTSTSADSKKLANAPNPTRQATHMNNQKINSNDSESSKSNFTRQISPEQSTEMYSRTRQEEMIYAGFGSSSPHSSTESSCMSLNSASSKNSSLLSENNRAMPSKLALAQNGRATGENPQQQKSPQDTKPTLAVKGISAPKSSRLMHPSTKLNTPRLTKSHALKTTFAEENDNTEVPDKAAPSEESPVKRTSVGSSQTPSNLVAKTNATTQSPTVGIVSPMMSHKTIQLLASSQVSDAGNQSDASTTSGSRDSDNSIIFNPTELNSDIAFNEIQDKRAPPVPIRTSSRLETTFDANCLVTTTQLQNESDLACIRPMEPIIPRVPPSYASVVDRKLGRQISALQKPQSADGSTSDDSLDSVSTTIRCIVQKRPSGYVSEGESLLQRNSRPPELPVPETSNGYLSEGGITIYAQKMQARFREGLEAVRDSMRNKHGQYNDSFEDSSSISSGISENLEDLSTDDLTGSSLSDYPMATTAVFNKIDEYQRFGVRQLNQKRSSSASQPYSNSARLQQRKYYEQENIDQLLQKCRTSQRGIACNAKTARYSECGQRVLYHTLGAGNLPPVPQFSLSEDGETLSVRDTVARSSMRTPSKRDHQVQAGPGFGTLANCHSLDRKAHIMDYYKGTEGNPCRLAVLGQETSAAAMALVSPRRFPYNNQIFLARPNDTTQNRHSVAAGMSRSMILVPSDSDSSLKLPTQSEDLPATYSCQASISPRMLRRIPLSVATPLENGHLSRKHGASLSARRSQGENIYANFVHKDANLQLYKLSEDSRTSQVRISRNTNELGCSASTTKSSPIGGTENIGSQQSLISCTGSAHSTIEERYETEIKKLNKEVELYKSTILKLTAKHDGYNHLIQTFDNKLNSMSKHLENLQNKSQLKKEEMAKLRLEIEQLRTMSINAGIGSLANSSDQKTKNLNLSSQEGAGELLRHPSMESVTSSSMSSSSKGSKTDKSSLNSFGKQGKKSWIRSSFTKAFSKNKKGKNGSVSDVENSPIHTSVSPSLLKPISGSANRLDELSNVPQLVELKKQLEDKDSTLTDVRLEALDKAREVDILKETINRLKTENKILKHNYTVLEKRMRAESRASSQQSLPVLKDDDPVYEIPPLTDKTPVRINAIKVTVSVDLTGLLRVQSNANEISIGNVRLPAPETTWKDFDSSVFKLFSDYISRIDPTGTLELHGQDSVIGYEFGDMIRDVETNSAPSPMPIDVLNQNSCVRIYLKGVAQRCIDGLVLDCLFPRSVLDQLLKALLVDHRLILFGATGIGKSNLARQLAKYLSLMIGGGLGQGTIVDIKINDEDQDKNIAQAQKELESLLRSSKPVIILLDNVQRHRISLFSSSFNSVDVPVREGPYVICTVNRASQLPDLQIHHNFRMFLLPNNMEAIRGYMGRFLRRRILESEFRADHHVTADIYQIIDFLPKVLAAVNSFIEKANSRDVTIGPRLFLQCPLSVHQSLQWFIKLWNQMIIPYMVKVAKEGVKVLGRCGSFEDPTDIVSEYWPWLDGPPAESVLQRLSTKETICSPQGASQFDPLEALMRIQSNNTNARQEVN